MVNHVTDALKKPDLVQLDENLFVIRFEAMKIYSALHVVEDLLKNGKVHCGDTLIDSSSGLYAYALALACHRYGVHCHIVASKSVDQNLLCQLEILGATVEKVQGTGSLKRDQDLRVARVQQVLKEKPGTHWTQQYHDRIHYEGYREVAAQIHEQLPAGDLSLVGAVGSGCSTGGIYQALCEHRKNLELVGIQPFGSITFNSDHINDPEAAIAGIGSAIPFDNVQHQLYDYVHWISFEYASAATVALLRKHALFAGLSSGYSYLAAHWEAERKADRHVIFIAADTGHRYVEPVFAKYGILPDADQLQPVLVESLEQLKLPWSRIYWNRRKSELEESR